MCARAETAQLIMEPARVRMRLSPPLLLAVCLTIYFVVVIIVLTILFNYDVPVIHVNVTEKIHEERVENLQRHPFASLFTSSKSFNQSRHDESMSFIRVESSSFDKFTSTNNSVVSKEILPTQNCPSTIYAKSVNTTNPGKNETDSIILFHEQMRQYTVNCYHECESAIACCIFLYGENVCNLNQSTVVKTTNQPETIPNRTLEINLQPKHEKKLEPPCTTINDLMCKDDIYRLNPANNCFAGNTTCWSIKPAEPTVKPNNTLCFTNGVFNTTCWLNLPSV